MAYGDFHMNLFAYEFLNTTEHDDTDFILYLNFLIYIFFCRETEMKCIKHFSASKQLLHIMQTLTIFKLILKQKTNHLKRFFKHTFTVVNIMFILTFILFMIERTFIEQNRIER